MKTNKKINDILILSFVVAVLVTNSPVSVTANQSFAETPTKQNSARTANAFQLPCAKSVQFSPYIVQMNVDESAKAFTVPYASLAAENTENCIMTLNLFDPEGNKIASGSNLANYLSMDGQKIEINAEKFQHQFTQDGVYTLKFIDQNGALVEGVLAMNQAAPAVLGASMQRESFDTVRLTNLAFYLTLSIAAYFFFRSRKLSTIKDK